MDYKTLRRLAFNDPKRYNLYIQHMKWERQGRIIGAFIRAIFKIVVMGGVLICLVKLAFFR